MDRADERSHPQEENECVVREGSPDPYNGDESTSACEPHTEEPASSMPNNVIPNHCENVNVGPTTCINNVTYFVSNTYINKQSSVKARQMKKNIRTAESLQTGKTSKKRVQSQDSSISSKRAKSASCIRDVDTHLTSDGGETMRKSRSAPVRSQHSQREITGVNTPTTSTRLRKLSDAPLQGKAFEGQTLRQLFGPFLGASEIENSTNRACHEVNLFGKVVGSFKPKPNKIGPEQKKRPGVRSRRKNILQIDFEIGTEIQKTSLPLKSFYDSVNRLKSVFKKGKRYIVCGVKIQRSSPEFNSSESEYEGFLDHCFVHQLSPGATLDSRVEDELPRYAPGHIPVILLKNFTEWTPSQYIQGQVIDAGWTNTKTGYRIIICDATGTVTLIAFGSTAEKLAAKGRIKLNKTYRVEKGNGEVQASFYISGTSSSVQLKVGPNSKIRQLDQP